MSQFGLFNNINQPLGSGLFTVLDDVAGSKTPPVGNMFLSTETPEPYITESGINFIIE
jgi:hypothetical protein